jgi:hypothetical protein
MRTRNDLRFEVVDGQSGDSFRFCCCFNARGTGAPMSRSDVYKNNVTAVSHLQIRLRQQWALNLMCSPCPPLSSC